MLEKILREVLSILARKTKIFNIVLRVKVRNKLKIFHSKLVAREKEAIHRRLMTFDPGYKNRFKIRELLESVLLEFTHLATAHYNEQLDILYPKDNYKYYARVIFEDELSLAENYLSRNRSRLFEWWCLHGGGRGKFLDECDLLKLELGYSFDSVFLDKMRDSFGITVEPDENHYNGGIPAILKDDNLPNQFFMKRVMSRM